MVNPFSATLRARFCVHTVHILVSHGFVLVRVSRRSFLFRFPSHLSHDRQSHQSDVRLCSHLVPPRHCFLGSGACVHHVQQLCRSDRPFPPLGGGGGVSRRCRSHRCVGISRVRTRARFGSNRDSSNKDPGSTRRFEVHRLGSPPTRTFPRKDPRVCWVSKGRVRRVRTRAGSGSIPITSIGQLEGHARSDPDTCGRP